eukprot:NODE_3635_length_929_cov_9.410224_g3483_i0.p1 GENE.NODE_3635_length_929_cov_9.410224_g3483_i0~~NODE_3635_length_929_cov_9.410224_g3483_i0.p1  ORF type:complete len:295 (+),score=80.44 NODE_3635_length_929_cov_9.410224_g3483_i0:45-887(+)
MNWLRSLVSTPASRCTDFVERLLQRQPLTQEEWAAFHADIAQPEIPDSLIGGLPGLVDSVHQTQPEVCSQLLIAISRASAQPHHAASLVKADAVPLVWSQWQTGTTPEMVEEILAILRNLVLWPAGGEAFFNIDGALVRAMMELDRGGVCLRSIECRVHMLSLLANLMASHKGAALQMCDYLPAIVKKFEGNTQRFAVAVAYNLCLWAECLACLHHKGGALLRDPLVRTLGDVVLGDCENKALEYKMASRILNLLSGQSTAGRPATFPWANGHIFSGGEL